ncbi:AraC family transcriptional regulator [Bacteroidota bacterium]
MARSKNLLQLPELSSKKALKTLIENRSIYNLESCELNIFETYQTSEKVQLQFTDLVVTSMLRGKKVMHLFDEPGFDYLPGESVIIPAHELMKIDFPEASTENPTQCLALAISASKINQTLDFLNEKYPRNDMQWDLDSRNYYFYNNEDLAQTINKLIQTCKSDLITKDALADLSLQELLVRIIQTQTLKSVQDDQQSIKSGTVIHAAVEWIRIHLSEKINLNELCTTMAMSQASLYRLFKRELGISPLEFIILERIRLAKKLLTDQKLYIKNVSYEAGFEDCNYFIRTFKSIEGITPKQYRKLHLNNQFSA